MDDKQIVDLYWARSEAAISETDRKYGHFCHSVAYNVLSNNEDAEESVNDTYLATWNNLPPHRPAILVSFLGKITRRLAIDRWRARSAAKRGGGEVILALDELGECVSDRYSIEETYLRKETIQALNQFLSRLPETQRDIFVRRYFLMDPVRDIAASAGFTEGKVTSMLHRTREKLRDELRKEGLL